MTYVCSGRGAATQEPCSFRSDDSDAAFAHFESSGHDVEHVDRHARWSVANIMDARDTDLRDQEGALVRAWLGAPGGWYVGTAENSVNTDSAVNTAAYLNHIGALPQREHDALAIANPSPASAT